MLFRLKAADWAEISVTRLTLQSLVTGEQDGSYNTQFCRKSGEEEKQKRWFGELCQKPELPRSVVAVQAFRYLAWCLMWFMKEYMKKAFLNLLICSVCVVDTF